MNDYDLSGDNAERPWPTGYSSQGYGAPPSQLVIETPEEIKRKKLKQTKIGIGLLIGAVGCMILGLLLAPIPCIGALLSLGMLGLGISAYILMLLGANAIEKTHKTLLITSMVLIIIAFLFTIVIAIMTVFASMGTLMGSTSSDEISGQDMRDFFESIRTIAFVGLFPNMLMAIGYAMILFKPAKKWGRPLLGVFLGLAVLSSIGSVMISYTLMGDIIDEIDPNKDDYTLDDMTSFQKDITMNSWAAGLVRVPEYIIYLIVAIGAFINVKHMEEKAAPKLDSRLYDLRL
jgi:hypothetical protein